MAQPVQQFKFLDETSVWLNMTRRYGRAAPGVRVVEHAAFQPGQSFTSLAVLGWDEVLAPLFLPGPITGTIFYQYLEQCVVPVLQTGDVLVLDNLSAHKVAGLAALLDTRGAKLLYLPPYSPDFNPIELLWSKVKTRLRQLKARTQEALLDALAQALRSVTQLDIQAWFAHCGYPAN